MPEAIGQAATSVRRYLTFRSGSQNYALPAEEVAEIIIMPTVARLPQSPPALLGMANLRGSVIAVASLRGLLGAARRTGDRARYSPRGPLSGSDIGRSRRRPNSDS